MPVGREYWRARALTAEPWRNAENSRVRAPSFFRVQPTNANGVVVSDTQDLHLHDVARDDETHQLVRTRPMPRLAQSRSPPVYTRFAS